MPIEDMTVNVTAQRITFDTDQELFDLRLTLKEAGWSGSGGNSRKLDGTADPDDRYQMTSPEGQVLIWDMSTTIALVNGVYTAMTADEFDTRYPPKLAARKATRKVSSK